MQPLPNFDRRLTKSQRETKLTRQFETITTNCSLRLKHALALDCTHGSMPVHLLTS